MKMQFGRMIFPFRAIMRIQMMKFPDVRAWSMYRMTTRILTSAMDPEDRPKPLTPEIGLPIAMTAYENFPTSESMFARYLRAHPYLSDRDLSIELSKTLRPEINNHQKFCAALLDKNGLIKWIPPEDLKHQEVLQKMGL